MESKNARGCSNAANPADELDITLSADGSLIKKPIIGNTKRSVEKSSGGGGSPDSNDRLLDQDQQQQQKQQDKKDFGPVHRYCQIFNVLVNLRSVENIYFFAIWDFLILI
jgi:hypothetical protein